MHNLFLSILSSTCLIVFFKLFDRYKVSTIQAIIINYLIAGVLGFMYYPETIHSEIIVSKLWFTNAIILGFVFISIFNVMAIITQKISGSVTSVTGKISMVIPVVFGILYYQESYTLLKLLGILLALVSIILIIPMKSTNIPKKYLSLPILLFIGSGFIDTFINYNQKEYFDKNDDILFTSTVFIVAFIIGLLFLTVKLLQKNEKLNFKSMLVGIILGIVNWASLYFLLAALATMESSVFFPVNNIGIVLATVFVSILLFKEKLNPKQWFGVFIAISAIVCISVKV